MCHFTQRLAADESCSSGDCRYYSATIIRMAGVEDNCQAIWYASITAFANFIFTFVGIALVERLGRRRLFLASLGGQCHYNMHIIILLYTQ